jgi:hypothetical protein
MRLAPTQGIARRKPDSLACIKCLFRYAGLNSAILASRLNKRDTLRSVLLFAAPSTVSLEENCNCSLLDRLRHKPGQAATRTLKGQTPHVI